MCWVSTNSHFIFFLLCRFWHVIVLNLCVCVKWIHLNRAINIFRTKCFSSSFNKCTMYDLFFIIPFPLFLLVLLLLEFFLTFPLCNLTYGSYASTLIIKNSTALNWTVIRVRGRVLDVIVLQPIDLVVSEDPKHLCFSIIVC